jgi:hypothetical protein
MSKLDDAVDKAYDVLQAALLDWAQARTGGDAARAKTSDALEDAYWKWDQAIGDWGEAEDRLSVEKEIT